MPIIITILKKNTFINELLAIYSLSTVVLTLSTQFQTVEMSPFIFLIQKNDGRQNIKDNIEIKAEEAK